jgi:hypothetical protein
MTMAQVQETAPILRSIRNQKFNPVSFTAGILVSLSVIILYQSSKTTSSYASITDGSRSIISHYLPREEKALLATDLNRDIHYESSISEQYMIDHADQLYLNATAWQYMRPTCPIFTESNYTPVYNELAAYKEELKEYRRRVENHNATSDLRKDLRKGRSHDEVCKQVELHEDGLDGIFKSGQLSRGAFGKIEPLLPPLRHPEFCGGNRQFLLDMGYIVHDFGAMCRRLSTNSRIILIDMGASLMFHSGGMMPAVYLTETFEKFGFPFDHIYAFEITPTKPEEVFGKVPEKLLDVYHWINVGVDSDPESRLNPLKMLLNKFNEDDLVIVKLDIDTPDIEVPLAQQILSDDRFSTLIDHFYFEHHVFLHELKNNWGKAMRGSVKESFDMFHTIRSKGIATHYWP